MNSELGITRIVDGTGKDKGRKVVIIDSKKANYKGTAFKDLSNYEKRKHENLVFLQNAKDRPIIKYN